jgi:hydroxymethylpyrimidine/phosphomethylpyrimidine kinase
MQPAILCIGGLDPSGSAGLLADAEAVRQSGGRPLAVATAWTIQTRRGVRDFHPVRTPLILAQLEALFDDEAPSAVKLGMLGRAEVALALARFLQRRLGHRPLVVDPVLRASRGGPLFRGDREAYAALFRLSTALTPNLTEAAALLDWKTGVTWDRATMARAARELLALGPRAVLLKGGHLPGRRSDDLLYDARGARWLEGARLDRTARGTGCRFASALATRLGQGQALMASASHAKRLVRRYLLSAPLSASGR